LEPRGKILPDKNRAAIGNESSSKSARYSERMLTLAFLLFVERIFSHISTKYENSL
jgi:hypothetical protein